MEIVLAKDNYSKQEVYAFLKHYIEQANQDVKDKNTIFVNHVHNHFKDKHPDWKVKCKICEKDIDEIYETEKE